MTKNDSRTSLKRKNSVKPQPVKNKSKMLVDTENELKRLLKEKQIRYAMKTYKTPAQRDNFSPSKRPSAKSPKKVKEIKKITRNVTNRLYYGVQQQVQKYEEPRILYVEPQLPV